MSDCSKESKLSSEASRSTYQTVASNTSTDGKRHSQETIPERVKEAGLSFNEMISSLANKTKTVTEEKTHTFKDKSAESISLARRDAHEIQVLGATVQNVTVVFEETMIHIERLDHNQQKKLLSGYKRLLEEQINVTKS